MSPRKLLNIATYVRSVGNKRYRSFIVHAPAMSGKTAFAKRAARNLGGKYLDLLDHFRFDEELKRKIDLFDVEALEKLLVRESKGISFLVVDHLDFLLNTWDERTLGRFFGLLERKWDNYKSQYRATVCYVLQMNRGVTGQLLLDSKGQPRIHRLEEFQAV